MNMSCPGTPCHATHSNQFICSRLITTIVLLRGWAREWLEGPKKILEKHLMTTRLESNYVGTRDNDVLFVGGGDLERDIVSVSLGRGGDDFFFSYAGITDSFVEVRGGGGNDEIRGTSGKDTLLGSGGDDLIIAGPGGNSKLVGGLGNDTLVGGSLKNIMFGGDGADSFEVSQITKYKTFGAAPNQRDKTIIRDLTFSEGDEFRFVAYSAAEETTFALDELTFHLNVTISSAEELTEFYEDVLAGSYNTDSAEVTATIKNGRLIFETDLTILIIDDGEELLM